MSELDEPGAGLPSSERFFLNVMFKSGTIVLSDERALQLFQREAETILEIARGLEVDLGATKVLIPRIQGIEDSSRHWSVYMAMRHLNMVNAEIERLIIAMKDNRNDSAKIDVADYKPDPDTGDEVIDEFENLVKQYSKTVDSYKPLKTFAKIEHPWFGALDGHGWHCLAAVHMRIHRRQIRKILAVHGVV